MPYSLSKAAKVAGVSKTTSLLTAFVFLGFTSNAYGMQICQMTDTLVWELESGFDIDPTLVEEYSEPYDVLVDDGVLYAQTYNEDPVVFAPIEFDEQGRAETDGGEMQWFKVSETEFRLLGYGAAWHSKVTCPDKE